MMTWMTISLRRQILQPLQWTAGLDRESVREGLLHFQALNEQHEREEHARQAEAMERASASGTVADDENPSG